MARTPPVGRRAGASLPPPRRARKGRAWGRPAGPWGAAPPAALGPPWGPPLACPAPWPRPLGAAPPRRAPHGPPQGAGRAHAGAAGRLAPALPLSAPQGALWGPCRGRPAALPPCRPALANGAASPPGAGPANRHKWPPRPLTGRGRPYRPGRACSGPYGPPQWAAPGRRPAGHAKGPRREPGALAAAMRRAVSRSCKPPGPRASRPYCAG